MARLDGPSRALRLLVDHRDDLVRDRTAHINRLRWHLHEIDPDWDPSPRSLTRYRQLDAVELRLREVEGTVARVAADLVARIRELTVAERALESEIRALVRPLAPHLLALVGVGALTAAKLVAETADVRRFRSKEAFARHNGTAPQPVWSGNQERHRLSRSGNRQLNAAIHRIAITQRRCHPQAKSYLERRITNGDTTREALRVLKRKLSDVLYRTLLLDAHSNNQTINKKAA